ncbi:MAG: hypothetical protein AAGP08_05325 [Pseudomonadota bacterium]
MIIVDRNTPPGFTLVRAFEPFSFDELLERAAEDISELGPAPVLGRPFLLDFREIDLMRFDAEDFKRLMSQRMRMSELYGDTPCAMVAKTEGGFGMLRMYEAYAEMAGLRGEGLVLITVDYDEAVGWISDWVKRKEARP